jgi:hypothetical protein
VDRGIAIPFRDLGARRGVWSASLPGRFTAGKDPVHMVKEAGGPQGRSGLCENPRPYRDSIPGMCST